MRAERLLQVASGNVASRSLRAPAAGFLRGRLRPALRSASAAVADQSVREVLASSRSYVTGLWARLNGQRVVAGSESLPLGMRAPSARGGACPTSTASRHLFCRPHLHCLEQQVLQHLTPALARCSSKVCCAV